MFLELIINASSLKPMTKAKLDKVKPSKGGITFNPISVIIETSCKLSFEDMKIPHTTINKVETPAHFRDFMN